MDMNHDTSSLRKQLLTMLIGLKFTHVNAAPLYLKETDVDDFIVKTIPISLFGLCFFTIYCLYALNNRTW